MSSPRSSPAAVSSSLSRAKGTLAAEVSTSMIMVKYSCRMVWLMSSTLTFFSLSRAQTAAMMPT